MSILSNYTRRCLKKNRVRTLVTVIGIVLSVALFTAVAEGAWSGLRYLQNVAVAENGSYHGYFVDMSDQEAAELAAQPQVTKTASLDDVGWAMVNPAQRYYPYLKIESLGEGATDLVSVRITEGRLPENEGELILSDRAEASTGVPYKLGQVLTLSVGQRLDAQGTELGDNNPYQAGQEQLAEARERVYKVVGFYRRLNYSLEPSALPGALALTAGASSVRGRMVLFTLKDLDQTSAFIQEHPWGSGGDVNRDLLLYSGASENRYIVQLIYGLVAILFGLIFFGSVALIYNVFSISVAERTKQFGLLKSIGATDRQLRRMVLTEAGLLCVVAIPLGLAVGCGGIGLTLRFLRPAFSRIIGGSGSDAGVPIVLVLHLPSLALAAGIGLVTALISAWIPARRASRLSPIAAIRQNSDVKIKNKSVRVSPLTKLLFGFPGMLAAKNFKRNRKQYRSTVISLFMSIVLFISAFSFSDYLRRQVADTINKDVADLVIIQRNPGFPEEHEAEAKQMQALAQKLRTVDYVEEAAFADWSSLDLLLPETGATPEALRSSLYREKGSFQLNVGVYFLPEEDYRALCAQTGADPEARQAVAFAKQRLTYIHEDGASYELCPVIRKDALPLSVSTDSTTHWREGEMLYLGPVLAEDGVTVTGYQYVPYEAYDPETDSYDESQVVTVSPEEAANSQTIVIGGLLEDRPLASMGHSVTLYFPLSLAGELGEYGNTHSYVYLRAPQHEAALNAVNQALLGMGTEPDQFWIHDVREGEEATQALLLVLNVFTFGFIVLISLIAAANVFNTISTNVALRRREFATLKSVGMGNRAFGRMMRYECLLYGAKALLWGLPVSVGISWLIWKTIDTTFRGKYSLPWTAMGIAAASVFLVVFVTMLYATGKIR
ncbi:MAG: ABC transporter permease, partial [Oscillospiraceae bacterium]|nr:ABC transporter permease [Oscillospiraceae bacterium]